MCCLICHLSELDLMKLKSPNMIVNKQRWNPKILSLAPGLCFDFHPNVRPTLKIVVHLTYAHIISDSESCERDLEAHAVILLLFCRIQKSTWLERRKVIFTSALIHTTSNSWKLTKPTQYVKMFVWFEMPSCIFKHIFSIDSSPFPRVRYTRLHGHRSVQTFS